MPCGKAELGERVGLGCTGPKERRERAKSGSAASMLMASSRVPLARACGLTVGPGCWEVARGGRAGALLVACEVGGGLLGYLRAAAPAVFEAEEPMSIC